MSETGVAVRLSICIATRNRSELLQETLEIFAEQMITGVEVVVADGASTDNTPQMLAKLANDYSWLRYFSLNSNGGIDADYDFCVRQARGKYCWMFSAVAGCVAANSYSLPRRTRFNFY